ncbi:MAG: tetratricopeptide repeat protein [candidate division Zixibacteria bacterium]|nr:tetratricopeptide repeat protein [candidate division Zixibacteria bacterium]
MAVDHYSKEWAYFLLKDYAQALTHLEKAVEKSPEDGEIWFFIGYCQERLGNYQEAEIAYQHVIQTKSHIIWTHAAHFCLGFTNENLGRYDKSIEAYKQAIKINPEYAKAYQNLAVAYTKLNRFQEAFEATTQAIRLDSKNIEAHYLRGLMSLILGSINIALEEHQILKMLDQKMALELLNAINKTKKPA